MVRVLKLALIAALVVTPLMIQGESVTAGLSGVEAGNLQTEVENSEKILSPIWGPTLRQWSAQINVVARAHGIDPDLIAAVVNAESNGIPNLVSRAGAVGLMGVMPAGPGLEWRPSAEKLSDPTTNLRWGTAILADVIRQSGGDIYAALAAYSGGWDQANRRVPQEYAARVLDQYARAVAARSGISPDIASQWTMGIEIRRGHIPVETLILGRQPVSGLHMYGEHVVFHSVDKDGRALSVKGYAIPVALVVPIDVNPPNFGNSDTLEPQLMVRLGLIEMKVSENNPRVLLACLPSLSRLRGRLSTRWFAPASCPSWHR